MQSTNPTSVLYLRLPPWLKDKLDIEAARQGLSANALARNMLSKSLSVEVPLLCPLPQTSHRGMTHKAPGCPCCGLEPFTPTEHTCSSCGKPTCILCTMGEGEACIVCQPYADAKTEELNEAWAYFNDGDPGRPGL